MKYKVMVKNKGSVLWAGTIKEVMGAAAGEIIIYAAGAGPWKMSSIPDVNGAFTTAAVGAASQPDVGLQNDSPSQAPQAYTPTMMG